jgi:DNA-binding NarL/FixJ family response regulator
MRIAIVEDSGLFRQALSEVLKIHGLDVVGQFEDAQGIEERVRELRPDAVIMDMRLPPTFSDEGITAAAALRTHSPDFPVLILSAYSDASLLQPLLVNDARGLGYLLKDRVQDVDGLVDALNRLIAGETVVDPTVIQSAMSQSRPVGHLSPRERTILSLIAAGYSNSGIAVQLMLNQKTVEKHISNIFVKLGLASDEDRNNRVLAVLKYLRTN